MRSILRITKFLRTLKHDEPALSAAYFAFNKMPVIKKPLSAKNKLTPVPPKSNQGYIFR